jgi:hypothetical protein
MLKVRLPLLFFAFVLIFSACTGKEISSTAASTSKTVPTQTAFTLATPYAQQPAAGICASFEGEMVVVTLNIDIPDPRCAKVNPDQKLTVINNTQAELGVSIGPYKNTLAPGGQFTIDKPFGEYLAAGVHQLTVTPCCGPEIWLEEK